MLHLHDVHAGYGATPVLRGISLSVASHQVVALLGRNGMGKTTTIRTIIGQRPTTSGRISYQDQDLREVPLHKRAQMGIGLVPETRQVFPSLTIREHLELAARPGPDGVDRWPYERLVELFPVLAERSNIRGNNLSGGEQQLLVTARALSTNPSLLLLDEPTEGLAPSIVADIAALISRLRDEPDAPAMLLVEQNLQFALGVADEAYVLVSGEVAYHGTGAQLLNDADTQKQLLGVGAA